MPNRLANESSPYLLQHAENPVDWYPWSDEALARSGTEDKPIFLSIGYSACHWCHVMEHESFEDPEIAAQLNENFVCIKVDREERPDLDQIYMQAVQILTGRGGWPMSVFLAPTLEPFFGGTYWPPQSRHGMPGFEDVIRAVLDAWTNRRDQAIEQARTLTERIQFQVTPSDDQLIDLELLDAASRQICAQFDYAHGGFGQAPKFPHSMAVQFLLRMWSRNRERNADLLDVATKTLDHMAAGGIYDHLAGGFARYSVDERWLVPHFEKMLYDNALLSDAYLDAFTATGNSAYARIAREICDYIVNYMTDEQGGFHSTEDADSEGEEGKFYVWTLEEIQQILGQDLAERFAYVYDISAQGNFEGKNIPNLPKTLEQCAKIKQWDLDELQTQLATARVKLLDVRDQRVRPGKDDKILASWNGLMIHSMARASGITGEQRFLDVAVSAAEFVLNSMRREDGRLLHTWRQGVAKLDGYLDDYANLANAFVTLYESTFDDRWLAEAVTLAEVMLRHFADKSGAGFFYTADDHEALIARMKDVQDSSIPSGNAMAATVLIRLGHLCGRSDFLEAANGTFQSAKEFMSQYPLAVGQMLVAADSSVGPFKQIVLATPPGSSLADRVRRSYLPRAVLAAPSDSPHLEALVSGKSSSDSEPRMFVCEDFTCRQPQVGNQQIEEAIEQLQ